MTHDPLPTSAAPPKPLDGICENRGCTNKAVRLAYDDEHEWERLFEIAAGGGLIRFH